MNTQDWSPVAFEQTLVLFPPKRERGYIDEEESKPVSVSSRWWCQAAGGADAAQAIAGMLSDTSPTP